MTSPFKHWRKKMSQSGAGVKGSNEGVVLGTMPSGDQRPESSTTAGQKSISPSPSSPISPMVGQQLVSFVTTALADDLATLSAMGSIKQKIAFKKDTLLAKYADYVDRLKAGGLKHELIGYYLVWLFDTGEIAKGVELGDWCMENGHSLPERFSSDVPFCMVTQLVDWADGELKAGRSFEPFITDILEKVLAAPETWNLTDPLMGGLYRLKGLDAEQRGELELAAEYLQKAYDFGAKVKTKLEDVQKRLARA